MKSLMDRLTQGETLVSDGAWGTLLQSMGLQTGESPESWNLTHPDKVRSVAQQYVEAGSDIVLTNSFGGSRFKLERYGLSEKMADINRTAAALSREAAGDRHVLGSIGPTGKMLIMGEVTETEWIEAFGLQARALTEGGAEGVCIETMSALDEALCAIQGVHETTDCIIACTFTFERTQQGEYRTLMGVSPAEMAEAVLKAGADIIGTNCGNGMQRMVDIVHELRAVDGRVPVLVHANAGMPVLKEGKTVFPESPDETASWVAALRDAGANIIGGCCGTTPAHIRAIVQALK
jgi:5-methyltetrahydrofolate--homocysteine methyltransferase